MTVRIPDVLAMAVIASILAIPPCLENVPPDFHVEVAIPQQSPELTRTTSAANASSHTVTYSLRGFMDRNGGDAGQLTSRVFHSVGAAKNAAFPDGCTFARFEADGGVYVFHSLAFGWEFFES
jgi:hypothetical protein